MVLPIYDDIMGLDFYYGPRKSQLASSAGYYISRDASNMPTREWIGTSANGRYAHAHEDWSRSNSWKGTVATAWVTPNTAHRFALGFGTNVDPHDTTSRVAYLELRPQGIFVTATNPNNGYNTYTVSSSPVSAGTQYFLQLWWKPSENTPGGSDVYAYAYKPGTNERLGSWQVLSSDLKFGSTTGYFKRGVSVRANSGDPASDYSIAKVYTNHFNG